ncbi:MAG: acyltransferase family protein [Rhizomicrobium sp.]
MMRSRAGGEVVSIQYLRGVAAILVVAAHACDQFVSGPVEPAVRLIGQGGVDIFFVVSGYVMTWTAAANNYDRATFFRRRITRIVPLYWVLTFFTAALLAGAGGLARDSRFAWGDLIASLLFIPHVNAGAAGIVAPTLKLGWTLNYEMFFYAWFGAFIGLTPFLRTACLSFVFSLFFAAALLWHPGGAVLGFWSNPIIVEFLFGCLVGCLDVRGVTQRLPGGVWLAILVFGAVSFLVLGGLDRDLAYRAALRGIPAFLIVLAAIGWERGAVAIRRSGVLHFLGDASYSIYLTHLFAIVGLRVLWLWAGLPTSETIDGSIFASIAVCIGTGAGCAAYLLLERPLIALVRRGSRHWSPSRSPA